MFVNLVLWPGKKRNADTYSACGLAKDAGNVAICGGPFLREYQNEAHRKIKRRKRVNISSFEIYQH